MRTTIAVALAVFAAGGCSLTALVGENDAGNDATIEDTFTPVDMASPPDVGPVPDVSPVPDVRPVPDVIRTVDAVVDLDAGIPRDVVRAPDDSKVRPVDRPRAEVALVGIDVDPTDTPTEMGIDAGPDEDRPPASCANDRDCVREMVPSRCDMALARCVPRCGALV